MLVDPTFKWWVPGGPDVFRVEERPVSRPGCPLPSGMAPPPEPVLLWRTDGPWRPYKPLSRNTSLYRALAAVDPTPEGVLAFVRQYGRLGEGVEATPALPDGSLTGCEPLSDWRRTIAWIGEAIRLWDLAQEDNRAELAKVIVWNRQGEVQYRYGRELRTRLFGSGSDTSPDVVNVLGAPGLGVGLFTKGDVIEPARCFVLHLVNTFLGRSSQPALHWDGHRREWKALLRFTPRGLLGAVALQFAAAILSGRLTRVCPVCGRYFEVTVQGGRNDRETCSDACRMKAYRERQRWARELDAAGWAAKLIAKELGSDLATIHKWLSKDKE